MKLPPSRSGSCGYRPLTSTTCWSKSAWLRGTGASDSRALAELDLWEPEDEGLEFDALVSLRDDLRQLCLLEKAHREALRKSFPDGAARTGSKGHRAPGRLPKETTSAGCAPWSAPF